MTWLDSAACLGLPLHWFDRTDNESWRAAGTCLACPVRVQCVTSASDDDHRFTVRGKDFPDVRRCSDCGEHKHAREFHYRQAVGRCRDCRLRRQELRALELKRCSQCREIKPLSDFGSSWCRPCDRRRHWQAAS
jgi:hypothetical protein